MFSRLARQPRQGRVAKLGDHGPAPVFDDEQSAMEAILSDKISG
jgi:hypothetical protein